MTTEIGTIRDALRTMRALLDNKESLLKINASLHKAYQRILGHGRHTSHSIDAIIARVLDGDERVTQALLHWTNEADIEELLADYAGTSYRGPALA